MIPLPLVPEHVSAFVPLFRRHVTVWYQFPEEDEEALWP
jgi:hypothetical protein